MNKTVLVVDDDKILRTSLSGFLEAEGIKVEQAADGKEGLTKALQLQPDLVVTDIKMPEMDGLEMLDQLRANEKGKDLRVVVLTNNDSTETINQALQTGVTVYLSKTSAEPQALVEQILTALF